MVFKVDLAAGTEAVDLFHAGLGGLPKGAEKFRGLTFPELVVLVVRADGAVLPAYCPVLFSVFNNAGFA